MKRRSLVRFTLANLLRLIIPVILVVLVGRVFHADAQTETNVVLGPMPSVAHMPDPLARQTAGDMRKWVQNFRPGDAKKLNSTGKIVFSWDDLKASYPEQARIVDDYVEQVRTNLVAAFKKDSHPLPDRLAVHHAPDTVEIVREGGGPYYRVVISSKEGIQHSNLEISER